jgi:DNA-binding MarR family transcriptional regulator
VPPAPELRLDTLVARVAEASGRTVLLMLDEIQTLGEVSNGDAIIAALRAVLHKRKTRVAAVFTGSSQSGLAKIMSTAGAPMYQFAQLLDFPVLGDDYLEQLSAHFARVHRGRKPRLEDLRKLFARLSYKPALMKDIVKSMSAEGLTDVEVALEHFIADDRQTAGWKALLESMEPFERSVLNLIAKRQPPMGREALKLLARSKGPAPTVAKVRAAIERLRKAGIVTRSGGEGIQIEDRLLAEYIALQEASNTGK